MFVEKVYIGLDHAPSIFDLRSRILGQSGANLDFIRNETGAVVILKGGASDKFEPLHLYLQHNKQEALASARSLAINLIDTVKQELAQWSSSQGQIVPPSLNIPPPPLPTQPIQTAQTPVTQQQVVTQIPQSNIIPAAYNPQPNLQQINVGPPGALSSTFLTVRPQYVQILPQQQVMLAPMQDGSQFVPILSQNTSNNPSTITVPVANASSLSTLGDISNIQPMQLRIASTIPTFLPNGISVSQVNLNPVDTTTVSAPNSESVSSTINSSHLYLQPGLVQQHSVDKSGLQDGGKQSTEGVHWVTPLNSQQVVIPYQYPQTMTIQQAPQSMPQLIAVTQTMPTNLSNINVWSMPTSVQPISIQTPQSLVAPSTTTTWSQQYNPGGSTITANNINTPVTTLNVWPSTTNNISVVSNRVQTAQQPVNIAAKPQGKAWSTQTTTENKGSKRAADGTPVPQLPLRPIAPAGSLPSNSQAQREGKPTTSWTLTSGRGPGNSNFRNVTSTTNIVSSTGMNQMKSTQPMTTPAQQVTRLPIDNNQQVKIYENKQVKTPNDKTDQHNNPNQHYKAEEQKVTVTSQQNYIVSTNIEQSQPQLQSQYMIQQPQQNGQMNMIPIQFAQNGQYIQQYPNNVVHLPNQQFNVIPSGIPNQTYTVQQDQSQSNGSYTITGQQSSLQQNIGFDSQTRNKIQTTNASYSTPVSQVYTAMQNQQKGQTQQPTQIQSPPQYVQQVQNVQQNQISQRFQVPPNYTMQYSPYGGQMVYPGQPAGYNAPTPGHFTIPPPPVGQITGQQQPPTTQPNSYYWQGSATA